MDIGRNFSIHPKTLGGRELYKYEWRKKLFHSKVLLGSPFLLRNGKTVKFRYDIQLIHTIFHEMPLGRYVKLETIDGEFYTLCDIIKTEEFGGKRVGSSTRLSDSFVVSLNEMIANYKKMYDLSSLPIKVTESEFWISEAIFLNGNHKADFAFLDQYGNECYWGSHKSSEKSCRFQQWSGVDRFQNHPEVKTFVSYLRDVYPNGVNENVMMMIHDEDLIRKSIFGECSLSKNGRNNVNSVVLGEMIIKKKNDYFEIKSNHLINSIDDLKDEYQPVIMATRRNDRSNMNLQNTRIGIYPIGNRKAKLINTIK